MSQTRNDPNGLYANFANIEKLVAQKLPGGFGMGSGSAYQHTVQSWSAAGDTGADGAWVAYYLVQIDSVLTTTVDGTFKIKEYGYGIHLCNKDGVGVPGVRLLAASPDSTEGATSYTTSMDESYSASIGFFGATGTGNLGYSASFGHSVSRQIPDITIHNRSNTAEPVAAWIFELAENADMQDTRTFTVQMLFSVPTSPDDQTQKSLSIDFHTIAWDDDHNGTHYHDETVTMMQPYLNGVRLDPWTDRGFTAVQPRALVPLTAPHISLDDADQPQAEPA